MRITFVIAATLSFILGCMGLYIFLSYICLVVALRDLEGLVLLAAGVSPAFIPLVLFFKPGKSVHTKTYFGWALVLEIAAFISFCAGIVLLTSK